MPGGSGDGALPGDYRVFVARAGQRPAATLFAFGVRDRVPPFLLPLRANDEILSVDLQAVLHGLYDRARFALRIDYRVDPVPPPRPKDAECADALLRRHGLQ